MSGFGNRPEDAVKPVRSRAVFTAAIAELDRRMALPAGHPDVLRGWGGADRVPVPHDLVLPEKSEEP